MKKENKPRSMKEIMASLENRISELSKKHIEANARPCESWSEAEERLRREKEREREEEQRNALTAPATGNVVRLPLWPDETRGVPNGILRSALFGAVRKGRRRNLKDELLNAVDGVVIKYTGERLDQTDLTVWETLLHEVREQNLGEKCHITTYSLLKAMGKAISSSNKKALRSSILRLTANAVEIKCGRRSYTGGLIGSYWRDEDTQELVIKVNPELKALYELDSYTLIEWQTRKSLEGQQLAQWLHGFYASHAKPLPMKLETLHKLSGSEAKVLKDFAKDLRRALDALAAASSANGQSFRYEIRNGLVYVEKDGTASQQRHLAEKRTPKQPKK